MNKKKVCQLSLFEEVAQKNNYEVFTPEEISSYCKEGLLKSQRNELSKENKDLFVADIRFLKKAICVDDSGKEVIRYYRPNQVDWEKTEDGILLKGLEGVYSDTEMNRVLNRVGQAYVPSEDFLKSVFENDEENSLMKSIDSEILKAIRTGRYADTPENRRLHRVGQPYKTRAKKGEIELEKKPVNVSSVQEKEQAQEHKQGDEENGSSTKNKDGKETKERTINNERKSVKKKQSKPSLTREKLDKNVTKLYKFTDSRKIERFVEDEFNLDKDWDEDEFYSAVDKTASAVTLFADFIDDENSKLKEGEDASKALENAKKKFDKEQTNFDEDLYDDKDDAQVYFDLVPVIWKELTKMDW